jgi:type VI protein secretion system component VasF
MRWRWKAGRWDPWRAVPWKSFAALNIAILLLVYIVVGLGLVAILRWTGRRLFAQLAASRTTMLRAVPCCC